MNFIKTPKGTELPLLDLRGKPYLQVAHRLVWFREEHRVDFGIETEIVFHDENRSVMRSTIKDSSGRILAQATKQESKRDFPDHLEKAETGSIGRALALCGYGTQFAPELDEGARIVDSPISIPVMKPNSMQSATAVKQEKMRSGTTGYASKATASKNPAVGQGPVIKPRITPRPQRGIGVAVGPNEGNSQGPNGVSAAPVVTGGNGDGSGARSNNHGSGSVKSNYKVEDSPGGELLHTDSVQGRSDPVAANDETKGPETAAAANSEQATGRPASNNEERPMESGTERVPKTAGEIDEFVRGVSEVLRSSRDPKELAENWRKHYGIIIKLPQHYAMLLTEIKDGEKKRFV